MDHDRLRNAGIKTTFPRLKILDVFYQRSTQHMSATDVYRSLMSNETSIGLATVYRVLSQLEEAGLLRRTQFDAHSAVFELNDKGHHDHLVCTHCGSVKESTDPSIAQLMRKIASRHHFTLDSYALVLYGNCGCQAAHATPLKGAFE